MNRRLAPAKLNLYLHLVGRRADGYHLLDSLFAFAGVGDRLDAAPAEGLSLAVQGPFAGALDAGENLVLAAARALAAAVGRPELGARLTLDKALPVAAGIGGGSSDAAAALRALSALWNLDLGEDALAAIGLGLGADVPACLAGRPVTVSGIGEVLRPAPALPPVHAVLVNPGVACPTPAVFRAFAASGAHFSAPDPMVSAPANAADLADALRRRRNDLEAPAISLVPVIAEVLAALAGQQGALIARMSGSGATCFALFASAEDATRAAATVAAARPDWWVRAAPLLT